MGGALIIGAGAAGAVATKKCAMSDAFSRVHLTSRTLDKCEKIQRECSAPITVSQVDADDPLQVIRLIEAVRPDIVINLARSSRST